MIALVAVSHGATSKFTHSFLSARFRPLALCLCEDEHYSRVTGAATLYDIDNVCDLARESAGVRVLPARLAI